MAALDRSPISTYTARLTARDATRLLWRAGFGPKPGQAAALAKLGLDGAVASLTRPVGAAVLEGAAPHDEKGAALDPINTWGDSHVWWLDRMVRSNHPLLERMTLIWHSWFATSMEASSARQMLDQNWMMRGHALGNFHALLVDVTRDPAMLLWLSGSSNSKQSPNENYAREMMELFTLGAGRGYSQADVQQQARALTGWTNDWTNAGATNFRFDPTSHDGGVKTIFGRRGRFDWRDSCRLCVEHPDHPSFLVTKLWGYLVGAPPPPAALRGLTRAYADGGFEVRPIVEAILRYPLFYTGPRMVIPPVVYVAGLHRASRQTITTTAWAWIGQQMGQMLFDPPNVAGWDYSRWLDTASWAARLNAVNYILGPRTLDPTHARYPAQETAAEAVNNAIRFWGGPELSAETHRTLLAFSRRGDRANRERWQRIPYRVTRQNALRALIPTAPEGQTC